MDGAAEEAAAIITVPEAEEAEILGGRLHRLVVLEVEEVEVTGALGPALRVVMADGTEAVGAATRTEQRDRPRMAVVGAQVRRQMALMGFLGSPRLVEMVGHHDLTACNQAAAAEEETA
jgi:hypothetical protein